MTSWHGHEKILTVPNALSAFRLAMVPVLLYVAWVDQATPFLILFCVALFTDWLDGVLARRLHQVTELGTRLDSLGDLCMYGTLPLCAWWLWPGTIRAEAPFVFTVIVSAMIPALFALAKFGRLVCYHTWAVKAGAALMSVSAIVMFADWTPVPFRVSAPVMLLAGVEEIVITCVSRQPRSNVKSLLHVLRERRAG